MPKGVLYVESRPVSPDRTEDFNAWYTGVHLGQVLAVEGIVSARRFGPLGDDGPFVAIYEIEGDDLQAVLARLGEGAVSGAIEMSDVMQMDPPPVVRVLEEIAAVPATGSV